MTNLAIEDTNMKKFTTDDAWPRPDYSIFGEQIDPPVVPTKLLEGWESWTLNAAEGCAAPVDYVLAGLITTASALIGTKRWVSPWAGWSEPSNLWGAVVGEPSSGKTPALRIFQDLMRDLEKGLQPEFDDRYREYERDLEMAKLEEEAWLDGLKKAHSENQAGSLRSEAATLPDEPMKPRLIVSDATPEAVATIISKHPKGLLSFRDELAGWIHRTESYNNPAGREFWLEANTGVYFVVDRQKNKNPIVIDRLSISVLGGIQPEKLDKVLMSQIDDGLAARFFMYFPVDCLPQRPKFAPDPEFLKQAMKRLLDLNMDIDDHGCLIPKTIRLSDAAAALFDPWRSELCGDLRHESGKIKGHFGKLPGFCLRLAAILTYLDWSIGDDSQEPDCIDEHIFARAAKLIDDYYRPMAVRVYRGATRTPDQINASRLFGFIQKKGWREFSRQELQRYGPSSLRLQKDLEAPLKELEGAGILAPITHRQGDTPGRKSIRYILNPQCVEGNNE